MPFRSGDGLMKNVVKLALLGVLLGAGTANAEPITYRFAGQFSGSLAGVYFTLANLTFSLLSDTDSVFRPSAAVRPTLFNSAPGTLRFSLNGASGSFDAPYNAFAITLFNNSSIVGLTETGSNDLIDVVDGRLRGYDLRTSTGPITNRPLDFLNFDTPFQTSLGEFVLFDDDDAAVTFSASLASAVPEPATWSMMILGLGATGFAMRRKARSTLRVAFAA
jgi:hypothetical protein